jgi:hypothetical protein
MSEFLGLSILSALQIQPDLVHGADARDKCADENESVKQHTLSCTLFRYLDSKKVFSFYGCTLNFTALEQQH